MNQQQLSHPELNAVIGGGCELRFFGVDRIDIENYLNILSEEKNQKAQSANITPSHGGTAYRFK